MCLCQNSCWPYRAYVACLVSFFSMSVTQRAGHASFVINFHKGQLYDYTNVMQLTLTLLDRQFH